VVALAVVVCVPAVLGIVPAKLVNVGVAGIDNGHSLEVTGWVVNTGDKAAYKTNFHVVCENVNGAKVIDTSITIGYGTISGKESVNVDSFISYSGPSLAIGTLEITPEWINSP
jgi:hypothetical protein